MRTGLAMLALAAAGCVAIDTEAELFACESNADCGAGWTCRGGVCREGFPQGCTDDCSESGRACCAAGCVDLSTNRDHCGACGVACASDEKCGAGRCVPLQETGRCANGLDDDVDGRVDCADTDDCRTGTRCATGTCCGGRCLRETTCANGTDDDCDGLVDCDDSDCDGAACLGGVCLDGACTGSCLIGGEVRARRAALSGQPCLVCDPIADPTGWTPVSLREAVPGCDGRRACDGAGACRAATGQRCASDGDCASRRCRLGTCVL